jgi:hypothetical protein
VSAIAVTLFVVQLYTSPDGAVTITELARTAWKPGFMKNMYPELSGAYPESLRYVLVQPAGDTP